MIFNDINYNKSTGIRYIYDAAGVKIAKEIYENGGTSRTNYFGNFVYEDTELKYILTDYGKIDVKTSVSYGGGEFPEIIVTRDYTRYYNITDHLGNVRVTFDETGEIMQEDSYYPFGMTMNGLNYTSGNKSYEKNKYLYNGKELQEDFGLDWYDYGARFYDAQLGRFTGVDALADTFVWVTPYNYAENSPIANIDLW
ncbi:MAG: hypothetical protein GXO49_01440, partial [Chlorobi bacterium]|nr:hypothetical protein [Chlorobiota bacterium]